MKVFPGVDYPLGAVFDGAGTNFSLFSEIAERVELCLFDENGRNAHRSTRGDGLLLAWVSADGRTWTTIRIPCPRPLGTSARTPLQPGQTAARPIRQSHRGQVQWDEAVFPYRFIDGPEVRNDTDSAPFMPKCVVHQPFFDWTATVACNCPGTKPSSTKPMSKGSPFGIRRSPTKCAAPTRAWRNRR
jgi:isoamylase